MQRVKKNKKKAPKKVVITESELRRIKKEITNTACERTELLIYLAVKDELKISEEQLHAIMLRTDRYCDHLDKHRIELRDLHEDMENFLGRKIAGWD